jgi:uncharacterized protein with LGFP repeats
MSQVFIFHEERLGNDSTPKPTQYKWHLVNKDIVASNVVPSQSVGSQIKSQPKPAEDSSDVTFRRCGAPAILEPKWSPSEPTYNFARWF